jgi:endonuclease/exonuclease/phosphatase family metal-dependent hydrolase
MRRFRVATYNIHKARGMDGRTSIDRIARVLEEIDADVIALQEVVSQEGAGKENHQAHFLSHNLGYWAAIGETRKHNGGIYGNVTLSRRQFYGVRQFDVSVPGKEKRGVLRTDIPISREVIHIFNTHLGTSFFERRKQAQRLVEEDLLKAVDISGPRVLLGDFNEWVQGTVTRMLRSEFRDTDLRRHLPRCRAYPMALPLLKLDHIYFDSHLEVENAKFHITPRSLVASDHLPLVADFRVR